MVDSEAAVGPMTLGRAPFGQVYEFHRQGWSGAARRRTLRGDVLGLGKPFMSIRSNARPAIAWSQVLLGGLIIALADAAFATTYWFSWDAAGVTRMFQSIALGALGQASFDGGTATAALGALLHLIMATMFVAAYALVAQRRPALLERLLGYGIPYGLLMYVIMNFIVMPLSRVGRSPSLAHWDRLAPVVIAHVLFGVLCVLFARRALGRRLD